ncbi:hypothetical protein IX84_29215 [Phaeodactylibacter xiamenensis]|uniref:Secretion system C-terminal sorting domain-containing protein n=2 Tax=Phaeodactylibacter xiamenensis TaxID=1524460 RepID=A0A098RZ60_9BACT|nr:hypothetical protein IX84_29215 [Phaeodactylibacter xiamenensis]
MQGTLFGQAPFSKALYLDPPEQIASIATEDSVYYLDVLSSPPPLYEYVHKMAITDLEAAFISESVVSNGARVSVSIGSGNQSMAISDDAVFFVGNIDNGQVNDIDGYFLKKSKQGDSLWLKSFGGIYNDRFYGIDFLNDSTLIVHGDHGTLSPGEEKVWVMALDLEGNILWERFYAGEYGLIRSRDLAVLENGNVVIVYRECLSYQSCGSGIDKRLRLLCIDPDGNELWTSTIGEYYLSGAQTENVIELDNSQLLVSFFREIGQGVRRAPVLLWVSPEGEVLQQYDFEFVSLGNYISDLFLTEAGNIIGVGASNTYLGEDFYGGVGWVFSMTQSGELNWERMYLDNSGGLHLGVLNCGIETEDGGLIFGGFLEDTILLQQTAWLLKLDSAGCYHPNCEEGLQFVDVEEVAAPPSSVSTYRVYPNPISGGAVLQLEALVDMPRAARAQWMDAYGRHLAEHALDPLPLQNIPVGDWPPGVYFLRLMEESGRALQVLRVLVE